jgi:predicted DNA-binding transcriptional regulator AlpA
MPIALRRVRVANRGHAMRPWLTTRQLADRWQTSERTVERKRLAGTGPRYVRVGEEKAVRYPPEEVEAWEAAQLVSSTSEEVAAGRRSHKIRTQIEPRVE